MSAARTTLHVIVVALSSACAAAPAIDDDDAGTGTGDTQDTGVDFEPCTGTDSAWVMARTGYPQQQRLWSQGELFVAAGGSSLLIYDGEAASLHEGLPRASFAEAPVNSVVATGLDDVWVGTFDAIQHWDGQELSLSIGSLSHARVFMDASGEPWVLSTTECGIAACPTRLRRRQDQAWVEQESPGILGGNALWVGADDELWVGGQMGALAHREEGLWTIESLDNLSFDVDVLLGDGDGTLWAATSGPDVQLARRSPGGEWTQTTAFSGSGRVHLIPGDGDVLLASSTATELRLLRWDGVGEPSPLTVPGELAVEGVVALSGLESTLHSLSPGPSVHTLDASAEAFELHERVAYTSTEPWHGDAASVDAPLEFYANEVRRFTEDAWETALSIETPSGEGAFILQLYADSSDSAWLLVNPDIADNGRELWRWAGGVASRWDEQPHGGDTPIILWGTGPDDVWLVAAPDDTSDHSARLSRFDGDAWTPILSASDSRASLLDLAGDQDSVFGVLRSGEVLEWTEGELHELGEGLHADLGTASLARVGDELLALYQWDGQSEDVPWPDPAYGASRWDGDSWVEVDLGLPVVNEPPYFGLFHGDGYGRAWILVGYPQQLYRHDGVGPADTGWQLVDVGHEFIEAELFAAPDGALVHDKAWTAAFHWSCE